MSGERRRWWPGGVVIGSWRFEVLQCEALGADANEARQLEQIELLQKLV